MHIVGYDGSGGAEPAKHDSSLKRGRRIMAGETKRIPVESLWTFTADVMMGFGVKPEHARQVADVLVASDVQGIDSHGVPRLKMYTDRLRDGLVNVDPQMTVITETVATLALDADNGMGHPSSIEAMNRCIAKAKDSGLCMTTVRNSNHFGIAGYYASMALEHGLCGVAMTNATPLVVPTGARHAYLSTAPIAAAIPAGDEKPILIDAATSTVAWGKIEIARREGKPIPRGWAVDSDGNVTTDPNKAVALTPLGGTRETSGQKGFGLGLFVEVLCGQLAGGTWGRYVKGSRDVVPGPTRTGHAFMAWRIDAFTSESDFKANIDQMVQEIKSLETIDGVDRVMIPGEPEYEAEAERRANGIPLHPTVVEEIRRIGQEVGVEAPF
jgi:L-2-hydroxycarboxylate dehydrogenase (NAD+)